MYVCMYMYFKMNRSLKQFLIFNLKDINLFVDVFILKFLHFFSL